MVILVLIGDNRLLGFGKVAESGLPVSIEIGRLQAGLDALPSVIFLSNKLLKSDTLRSP